MNGEEVPDQVEQIRPIVILGSIMIVFTFLGIIMACCVRLTMNCICVTFEMLILLALCIVLIVFGALLVLPALYGKDYVHNNCKRASLGQFD